MKKTLILLAGLMAISATAIEVGEKAPEISLKNQDGQLWKLSEHLGGKHLVVYFYPAAMTGGCTKQACAYRDHLQSNGSTFDIIGISGDPVKNIKLFQTAEHLNFQLLSDSGADVAKAFGVPVKQGEQTIKRTVAGEEVELKRNATTSRWTFIIDPSGKVVYKDDQVKPMADLENVIAFLKKQK